MKKILAAASLFIAAAMLSGCFAFNGGETSTATEPAVTTAAGEAAEFTYDEVKSWLPVIYGTRTDNSFSCPELGFQFTADEGQVYDQVEAIIHDYSFCETDEEKQSFLDSVKGENAAIYPCEVEYNGGYANFYVIGGTAEDYTEEKLKETLDTQIAAAQQSNPDAEIRKNEVKSFDQDGLHFVGMEVEVFNQYLSGMLQYVITTSDGRIVLFTGSYFTDSTYYKLVDLMKSIKACEGIY